MYRMQQRQFGDQEHVGFTYMAFECTRIEANLSPTRSKGVHAGLNQCERSKPPKFYSTNQYTEPVLDIHCRLLDDAQHSESDEHSFDYRNSCTRNWKQFNYC